MRLSERNASLVLGGTALAAALGAACLPRIPQDPAYHLFADARTVLGVASGLNVLSNVAFAVVAFAGLRLLVRGEAVVQERGERWAWAVFFVGVGLTSLGSSWYHLAPSNGTLVWDRLPMAVAFLALLAATVAERVDPELGARLLVPMVLVGIGGVLFWAATEHAGAGDLRPYVLVQFFPLVAIPLILVLFPARYDGAWLYLVALGLYACAKAAELADSAILRFTGVVSGHTLKHLLAAAAVGTLVVMLARRRQVTSSPATLVRAG
jgi:predicted membrane channel-forming protein YqfA (hemolysin III family)